MERSRVEPADPRIAEEARRLGGAAAEYLLERAGIYEYEAGLPRGEADIDALRDTRQRVRSTPATATPTAPEGAGRDE